ncbi:MAG: sulfite exporter TauE/SafE family protein [Flavobacteriales bacterium]|nr:sulfite exporter TauE/SafE family protein [Flavobacteriales bacterium]
MDLQHLLIPAAALVASLLTLISGFGLGTLLLPVFALFFPLPLAVGMTAVVHLLNNLFKATLLWRHADRGVLLAFGIPAVLGALAGVWTLDRLGHMAPLYHGMRKEVGPLAIAIAVLMVVFAITELAPRLKAFAFAGRHHVVGGALSGFFGGLSGHQGALRSMFLLRSGLGKEAYIATGVMIAVLVDLTRIPLYLRTLNTEALLHEGPLLLAAVLAAFAGAWAGKELIPSITYRTVQWTVAVLMVLIAGMLVAGIA